MPRHSSVVRWRFGWTLAAALAGSFEVHARDYFLTIGGGYDPTGNQISIEENVQTFQRLLAKSRPDAPAHDVYFADGDDPARDLQYRDAQLETPIARKLMALIIGNPSEVGICYRDHAVEALAGPAERDSIERRLAQLGRELQAGDRLIIYVTGHGESASGDDSERGYDYRYDDDSQQWVAKSKSQDAPRDDSAAYDVSFHLWDNDPVSTREFTRWLDKISPEVDVVIVMVQCYSGGFAHYIFRNADPALGLSPARRAGFFAQVHDRPAAGCTPDAQETDLGEYSKSFLAALAGATRDGTPVTTADYDGDGRVSFAEAHAYAVIESETIDIPVRASETLLRQFSRLPESDKQDSDQDDAAQPPPSALSRLFGLSSGKKTPAPSDTVQAAGSLAALAEIAPADQRAILEQLAKKLKLKPDATVEQVRQGLDVAKTALATAAGLARLAERKADDALADLRDDVYLQWPELIAGYTPLASELTGARADEFVESVEALASYDAYQACRRRQDDLDEKLDAAQKTEAAWQRLLRTAETASLARNLEKSAPAEIVERYRTQLAIEGQGLAPASDGQ